VLWLLVLGGFFTVLGVAGLFRTPPELDDALRQWSLALLLLVQALLCSPSLYARPRVMVGMWAAAHSPYVRIVAMPRSLPPRILIYIYLGVLRNLLIRF
jgi:hypothetical protein